MAIESFGVEVYHPFHEFPSLEKLRSGTKRHAIYIPQSFFDKARQALALEIDAGSTWEFSAASTPLSTPVLLEDTSSMPSSPAQEMVVRYRAGMPIQLEEPSSIQPVPSIEGRNHEGGSRTAYSNNTEVARQIRPSFQPNESAESRFVHPHCDQTVLRRVSPFTRIPNISHPLIGRQEEDRLIQEDGSQNADPTIHQHPRHSNTSGGPEDFKLLFLIRDE